jgi:hypothetical protein
LNFSSQQLTPQMILQSGRSLFSAWKHTTTWRNIATVTHSERLPLVTWSAIRNRSTRTYSRHSEQVEVPAARKQSPEVGLSNLISGLRLDHRQSGSWNAERRGHRCSRDIWVRVSTRRIRLRRGLSICSFLDKHSNPQESTCNEIWSAATAILWQSLTVTLVVRHCETPPRYWIDPNFSRGLSRSHRSSDSAVR